MPRKRRRTAWTAAAEGSSFTYAPADTEVTILSRQVLRISRVETPSKPSQAPSDDIAEFPPVLQRPRLSYRPHCAAKTVPHPARDEDELAVLSFGSDAISPTKEASQLETSDPIHDSSPYRPKNSQSTPSQRGLSVRPMTTPPTAFVARSLLTAMDQVGPTPDKHGTNRSCKRSDEAASTPFMVTSSEIRRTQKCLGMSPDTPGSSGLRFLDPEVEREIRAVQKSTEKLNLRGASPASVPSPTHVHSDMIADEHKEGQPSRPDMHLQARVAREKTDSSPTWNRRRMSDMSTVTPIPLNLYSPAPAERCENVTEEETTEAMVLKQTNARSTEAASPITPSIQVPKEKYVDRKPQRPSRGLPSIANVAVNSSQANEPYSAQPGCVRKHGEGDISEVKKDFTSEKAVSAEAFFTSGPGNDEDIPPLRTTKSGKELDIPPLFTTGSGKKVDIPPIFKTGSGKEVNIPPLFTTGSGKKVDIPPLFTTGSGKEVDIPPLFTTGSGKKVQMPSTRARESGRQVTEPFFPAGSRKELCMPPLFSAGPGTKVGMATPTFAVRSSKDSLILPPKIATGRRGERGQHALLKKHQDLHSSAGSVERVAARFGKAIQSHVNVHRGTFGSGGKPRRGMKTTPFKRPRQVWRPAKPSEKFNYVEKQTCRTIPRYRTPRLLNCGRLGCQQHHREQNEQIPQAQFCSLDFLVQTGCLQRCLEYSFAENEFGCISCLPKELETTFHFNSIKEFRVDDCIRWISSLFPGAAQKPAPSVGSLAWTRLAYGLAVWKLGRLSRESRRPFLSAANVIREFLRRLAIEWHENRQPHLLRMMRRDSAPASHVVLLIADIERDAHKRLTLTLSDGWYLARAALDSILETRVLKGKLRIGEKIHLAGAGIQSTSTSHPFFCGEGDELSSSVLRVSANNLRKRKNSNIGRLGIQRTPLCTKSLRWVQDDAGQCPVVYAVILRSYPLFYMETVEEGNRTDQENPSEYVFRREDVEFEARLAHEEIWRQKLAIAAEEKLMKKSKSREEIEVQQRNVSCVNEVLVCGIDDDPTDQFARKLVRIYNSTEDVRAILQKEAQVVLLAQLWPKKSRWTGKSDGVILPRKRITSDRYSQYRRRLCSILELQSEKQTPGSEFDGVFIVLHVSSPTDSGDRRFAYFADEVGSEICVLALELTGADVGFLPKALRTTGYIRKFSVVALQNAQYETISSKHNLVHAKASIRTSFISSQALHRKTAPANLQELAQRIEKRISGKEAQLEVLREAVISFASGARGSIGAYFTSTQDT